VQGIPKLVLIDAETGQTITREGYSHLMEDENGTEFPWRRKKFGDIIKGKLLKEGKEVDALEELKGKIVGLYFSAHWVCLKF
jgi:nucleoredoxin